LFFFCTYSRSAGQWAHRIIIAEELMDLRSSLRAQARNKRNERVRHNACPLLGVFPNILEGKLPEIKEQRLRGAELVHRNGKAFSDVLEIP
jgi:hypothetical protein